MAIEGVPVVYNQYGQEAVDRAMAHLRKYVQDPLQHPISSNNLITCLASNYPAIFYIPTSQYVNSGDTQCRSMQWWCLTNSETPDGRGRMVHAMTTAQELRDAGQEVKILFEGQGVTWIEAFHTKEHPFHPAL